VRQRRPPHRARERAESRFLANIQQGLLDRDAHPVSLTVLVRTPIAARTGSLNAGIALYEVATVRSRP
jgi:hypothetical protein